MKPRVLIFSPVKDAHSVAVREALDAQGSMVVSLDLGTSLDQELIIDPGVSFQFGEVSVDASWTVWWRRSGSVPIDPRMSAPEALLRCEETEALVVGGLISMGLRWVDEPFAVARAELTSLQLSIAAEMGANVPRSQVTNVPQVARLLMKAGACVAKSTSSGAGLAPFADFIDDQLVDLLPSAPTLVQRYIAAEADLRIVVVANHSFIWQRQRINGTAIDWRATDPSGEAFVRIEEPEIGNRARGITQRLGLSFSVQDWVVLDGTPWFLEVNPSGQWLFLRGSEEVVLAMADHLSAREPHE